MGKITLPAELQQWAETEVAAGRAPDVDSLVSRVISEHRRGVEALHRSLLEAEEEADREGWIKGVDFLAEIEAVAISLEERSTRAKA